MNHSHGAYDRVRERAVKWCDECHPGCHVEVSAHTARYGAEHPDNDLRDLRSEELTIRIVDEALDVRESVEVIGGNEDRALVELFEKYIAARDEAMRRKARVA